MPTNEANDAAKTEDAVPEPIVNSAHAMTVEAAQTFKASIAKPKTSNEVS